MTDRWTPPGPALLFAPADRPERFAKAAERSDAVILDLEDGCRAENRASARKNIVTADLDPAHTIVRINPPGTTDFDADLQAVADSPFTTVMLPLRREVGRWTPSPRPFRMPPPGAHRTGRDSRGVLARPVDRTPAGGRPCLGCGWRHSAGLLPAAQKRPHLRRYTSRRLPRSPPAHLPSFCARGRRRKTALDSIHADTADMVGARAEAVDAAASGFAGTVAIHPGLVPVIREAYRPDDASVDWACRVVAGAAENSGAFAVDGEMIDAPLRRQAELILSRTPANSSDTSPRS